MKMILLIGGTGFIGSNLKSALLDKGYHVAIMSRNFPVHQEPEVTYYPFTLDNTTALESILPNCSHVVHMASSTTPGTSMLVPSVELTNNLLPLSRFLETLQRYKDIHLIFISSGGAIYGNTNQEFVREETLPQPLSYYGAGKAAIEAFLHAFQKQTGNSVTVLRPSNLYGKGQRFKTYFGIIPAIFNCLKNSSELKIWGDGEIIRDYLCIDDFVDLFTRIIQSKEGENTYQVLNAGSGHGSSINQLCELAESITKQTLKRRYMESRNVDVKRIVLDSGKALAMFDWKATTSIKTGLEKTWEHFQHI